LDRFRGRDQGAGLRADGPQPQPGGDRDLPPPAEITASLLEKERQILGIIEGLDEMMGEQNDDAM
jgi:hypothetical protein